MFLSVSHCLLMYKCYNFLIIGLCKAKKMEDAKNFLVEMIERGLKPNAYTYGAFFNGYCKAGEMQLADRYLREMLDCGIIPNDVIYTALTISSLQCYT